MIPSLPALHRPPYEFSWQMQSPWTGTWSGNGFVSSTGAASGAASAAESAAHAAAATAPSSGPASFRTAPGTANMHHTISFPDLARRDLHAHRRSFYRFHRRGPRLLPLLILGGLGFWGVRKVKHHVGRLEGEIDRLEGKVAGLQAAGGTQAPPAVAEGQAAATVAAPAAAEVAGQERRHGHRWGWGPRHGQIDEEQTRWEKSWGWGSGPARSRI